MSDTRSRLFDRLPEIHRTRDLEQAPAGQLRAFLDALEIPFDALHENVAQLYEDLFIDTCDDWVIPYIGDLLGVSHLSGEPRTLRADVADTIALRRRKGTLGAIERLAANLTGWSSRAVEMRENLGWTQHMNHQRPDAGGAPPLADPARTRFVPPRGGFAPIRDPAMLALRGTPFDPFAYTAEAKPPAEGARAVNLPDLAVFLWRLAAYRLPRILPLAKGRTDLGAQPAGRARFLLRFDLHPLDRPVRLFNTGRPGLLRGEGAIAPLARPDEVPGPMLDARLTSFSPAGHPDAYARIDFYDASAVPPSGFDIGDVGLQLFMPAALAPLLPGGFAWRYRGDNLCAWETGLRRPVASGEIVIDPDIGRLLIGLDTAAQSDELMRPSGFGFVSRMFAAFAYGAVGPVGAHPVSRGAAATAGAEIRRVGDIAGGLTLQAALAGLENATAPVVVEIADSLTHELDLAAIAGTAVDGGNALRLAHSLTIRAADGHRPIVRLARPLGFRPVTASEATPDAPVVRLEGLYLAADPGAFPAGAALIARAAAARLEIVSCTLEPGGHSLRNGARAPAQTALRLANGYGFSLPADEAAFAPTPDIVLQRSIAGAIAIDDRYRLDLEDCIVDAAGAATPAIGAATSPATGWGAPLAFSGLTCFGAARVSAVGGSGAIFTSRFEVLDNQHGCVKWSAFAGDPLDRPPPNHFCLRASEARIVFASRRFGDPAYAQLARDTDHRVLALGPRDDAMGAFGFLLEAHKFANLTIRLREFMPAGVRALVIPVT